MTDKKIETIICPKCNNELEIELYSSINVSLDPDLREKLFSRELFVVKCDKCNIDVFVPYPFLYHDMNNKFMIWVTLDKHDDYTALIDKAKEVMDKDYTFRLVKDINELCEKINIFESGYSDMVIEIIKCIYFENEKENANEQELFYITTQIHEEENSFTFHIIEKNKSQDLLLHYPVKLAEHFIAFFNEKVDKNDFYYIDTKLMKILFDKLKNQNSE